MATTSLAHVARPSTREQRGIALYRERGDEIAPLGHGKYNVPGCTGGPYVVDLAPLGGEESCSCPDHAKGHTCKHLIAATIYRAKRLAAHRRRSSSRPRFSPEQVAANLEMMGA